ncbi:hypothetical protein [Mycobacterium sp.]|uniref:hypothetical protein n=1 Tax=Mycobacterium sp. TaxID=1785 RepID=UPI0031D55A74
MSIVDPQAPSTNERRYEAALRRLPDAHSLALRLRDAGVADDVICGYLQIQPEGLDSVFELARQKLHTELGKIPEG